MIVAFAALLAACTPAPSPQPSSTPPATATAPPSPAATTAPSPVPVPSPSVAPYAYVVVPSPAPSGAPQIFEIAVNERVAHPGRVMAVRIRTSADVTHVVAHTMGQQLEMPQSAPAVFGGSQEIPRWVPFWFLNKTYTVDVVASTNDGRSTSVSVPIRLER